MYDEKQVKPFPSQAKAAKVVSAPAGYTAKSSPPRQDKCIHAPRDHAARPWKPKGR